MRELKLYILGEIFSTLPNNTVEIIIALRNNLFISYLIELLSNFTFLVYVTFRTYRFISIKCSLF